MALGGTEMTIRAAAWTHILMAGAVMAAHPADAQSTASSPTVTALNQSRSVQLSKLITRIKRGTPVGVHGWGICVFKYKLSWKTGTKDIEDERFDAVFRDEVKAAGFRVVGDPSSLFVEKEANSADYLIGGAIDRMDFNVCHPNGVGGYGDLEMSRGTASIDVEWQLYSQLKRRVVATIKTTGTATRTKNAAGGAFAPVFDAFADAVRQLVHNDRVMASLAAPVGDMNVARQPPAGLVPVQVRSVSTMADTPLTDVVASTVVVFANGGEGSGFLVSPDGYVLTNHHVVGDNQYVKVRWSDGAELLGEVIRSDKGRDIAVIKTDAKGRKPLSLRNRPVSVGEDVYAVGAPTGAKFQNTVTKGIVSASRVFNGYNFIQSDVAVTHGNSGGPIVDAKGQVVGLTDLGIDGAPMLNLFIPIGEALGFLGLQMTP
jgi:serine protease Do